MIKEKLTYTNFNDEEVTKECYFNISRSEATFMELKTAGGYRNYIQKIVDEKDQVAITNAFEKLIDSSYGIKSDDGEEFLKSPEILAKFKASAAYDTLIIKLLSDADYAAKFVNGIFPKQLEGHKTAKENTAAN